MAQVIRRDDAAFEQRVQALFTRSAFDPETETAVAAMLTAVRTRGDAALTEFAQTYDHVTLPPSEFRVATTEVNIETSTPIASRKAKPLTLDCEATNSTPAVINVTALASRMVRKPRE